MFNNFLCPFWKTKRKGHPERDDNITKRERPENFNLKIFMRFILRVLNTQQRRQRWTVPRALKEGKVGKARGRKAPKEPLKF